jgi:hypothetical protein
MARHEGGRWDVGSKNNAVYLQRVSESDEQLFDDLLAPEEARELAELLRKFADKAEESEDSDDEDSDDEDSDDEDSDDEDSDDEDSDDEDSDDEDSDDEDSDDEDSDDEDSDKSSG